MKRGWLVLSAIAFTAALVGLILHRQTSPLAPLAAAPPSPVAQAVSRPNDGAFMSASVLAPAHLTPTSLPSSLRGSSIDGGLRTDSHGHLIAGSDVRWLFDYFLTTTGEEPLATIRARIILTIRQRLADPAAAEAIALLDRYLEYRRLAAALAPAVGADIEARLAARRALRREVFGAGDATALFGDEEIAQQAALERQRIAVAPEMSPDERQRAIDIIEAKLPEAQRRARAQAMSVLTLLHDEHELHARGAAPEEIRALREDRFGREAADRLEALDRRRAAWNERVTAFREEKAAIESDTSLAPEERTRVVDELLESTFSPPERLRVKAILGY